MKININVQSICISQDRFRGIPYVVDSLTKTLLKRKRHSYYLSYYDYQKERNNRKYVEIYMRDYLGEASLYECNSISWKHYMDFWNAPDQEKLKQTDYETDLGLRADVHFFPQSVTIPYNLPYKKSIVTVNDIIRLYDHSTDDFLPELTERLRNTTKYLSFRKDILLTAISEYTKSDLMKYFEIEEERIKVVPLACNEALYHPTEDAAVLEKYEIHSPFILYLGAFEPRKGVDILCEAFSNSKYRDVKLVLAGTPEREYDIDGLIAKCARKSDIIRTGFVTDHEKCVLMSMAEMFVFPSYYEGFGLPVLEAMSCGTAVITTNASSLPEVGGEAAVYIEPGNSEELTEKIDLVLSDSKRRGELEKKGLERAKFFSWDKTAEQMEELFASFEK